MAQTGPAGEVVLLGMFDVSRPSGARAVRIHSLYTALRELTPITLLAGGRAARRRAVLRYLVSGGLRRARAVYVEASTSTAMPVDLLFLALARRAGIPLLVYVPDAYQDFPEIFPRRGIKVKLLDWGWRVSTAVYARLADRLLFPTAGLARCFPRARAVDLLPPAGRPGLAAAQLSWDPPTVVFVGAASHHDGADLLLEAMEQVVARQPVARCRLISKDVSFLAGHRLLSAPWLTVERRAADELPEAMYRSTLAVIPRRINAYNDLALPIKLFDYMSFGLPVVVTDCRSQADLVRELQAGLVVRDSPDSLAQGLLTLLADPSQAARLGRNGHRAVQEAHAWPHRAARLLQMIAAIEEERRGAHPARP